MKELEKFSRIYRAEFIKCGADPVTTTAATTAATTTGSIFWPIAGGTLGGYLLGSHLAAKGQQIRHEYENIAFNEFMNQLSPYLLGGLGGAIIGSLLAHKNRKYLQGALIGGGAGLLGTALYKTLYATPSKT
jgi:hypothetical protein